MSLDIECDKVIYFDLWLTLLNDPKSFSSHSVFLSFLQLNPRKRVQMPSAKFYVYGFFHFLSTSPFIFQILLYNLQTRKLVTENDPLNNTEY